MQIEKYIGELLSKHSSVVIPGLGGFMASYNPARIDDDQNTIHPPSKQITFNLQLKNDDGLLVNYICLQEGLSSFDAQKKVEEFREKIQYPLEKGEKVILEGLGSLILDEDNKPIFSIEKGKNFLLDSYGLDTVQIKQNTSEERYAEKPVYSGKKKNRAWLLFLFIPVAALAVFIYLNIYNAKDIIPPETNQPEVIYNNTTKNREELTAIDTAKKDSINVDSLMVIDGNPVAAVPEDTITEINYYLIGGNFGEKENADKKFAEIESYGFTPLHLGKQGGFYVVAVGGYSSLQEARLAKEEYEKIDPQSGVYVIRVNDDE